MSLFGGLFSAKRAESVVFIEIGPDSVGGAYARYEAKKLPQIIYTKRVAYAPHDAEAAPAVLSRALAELGELLVREGAPALMRASGSGSAGSVVVSVAAPWQEASIRVEKFEAQKPFAFTHALLAQALERSAAVGEGKVLADESVIATVLNGYEMKAPFGKKVSRASVMILSAAVDTAIAEAAAAAVRALFHRHSTKLTSLTRVEYESVRTLFPHEEEYLVIEARGASTSLLLVKRNCLVGALTIPTAPGADAAQWVAGLKSALGQLSLDNPLPHTIFLLAYDATRDLLKSAIEGANLETLWLSEGAPRVIAATPELTLPHAALASGAERDLFLSMLVLSYGHALYLDA